MMRIDEDDSSLMTKKTPNFKQVKKLEYRPSDEEESKIEDDEEDEEEERTIEK